MQPIGAVERDVVEIVFRRLDFLGVFLVLVAQLGELRMQEQRIGVERHLGVEAQQATVLGDDQRIDFQHRHVAFDEGAIEIGQQRGHVLLLRGVQPEHARQAAHMVRADAGDRIDGDGRDFSGVSCATVLDVHAAFGGGDDGDARRLAIDQHREIKLAARCRSLPRCRGG